MSEQVKKPGNPKMRQLREQNNELAASNRKLRQDLDTVLHKLNAQKKQKNENAQASQAEIQTLNQRLSQSENQIEQLEKRMAQKDAELKHKDNVTLMAQAESERSRAEVQSYANSTSWKITAPLRAIINIFK